MVERECFTCGKFYPYQGMIRDTNEEWGKFIYYCVDCDKDRKKPKRIEEPKKALQDSSKHMNWWDKIK